MKRTVLYSILTSICILYACEKKEAPTILTDEIEDITGTTATCGGIITDEGSSAVISRGVCWSTEENPTIEDGITSDGTGGGVFSSSLTGLSGATTYHVRAYATNSEGTGYGADMSFTTLGALPGTSTLDASDITITSATLNGTVNANYLSTAVLFEYGTTTSYGQTLTATQSPIMGNANADVSKGITDLSPGTTYHFRVKAVNEIGTTFGNDMTFTSLGQVPTATTLAATVIDTASATLNGTVNANDLSTIVTFEYGTTTDYGSSATASQSPVTGHDNTTVSATISDLSPGTAYYFRVKSVNSLGTTTGNDLTFTASGQVPTVTTQAATNITTTGATLNGKVNANYLSTTVTFEYGTTTDYGNSVTASQSPVIGHSETAVSAPIIGLNPGTTYHFRLISINSLGTVYGDDFTLSTFTLSVTDIDGNTYGAVKIGNQVWMVENLKTTQYSNGSPIPYISDNIVWEALIETDKAYCWYNNDVANKSSLGALYTWAAAMNGAISSSSNPSNVQGVCPIGWHLPSDDEWTELETYLITNGYNYDGTIEGNKIAKSLGSTTGWNPSINIGVIGNSDYPTKINITGFTAQPAGARSSNGAFVNSGTTCYIWSSTQTHTYGGWHRTLYYNQSNMTRNGIAKEIGLSVRCIKD